MAMSNERRTSSEQLSQDRILDLLSARRRRFALYCLYLYANPMRLPDVAEQVTEWEHGKPGEELLEERLRTYNDLYHSHVPKLDEADVIEYNQDEDMVELSVNVTQLRPYLERTAEEDLELNDESLL